MNTYFAKFVYPSKIVRNPSRYFSIFIGHFKKSATQHLKYIPRNRLGLFDIAWSFVCVNSSFVFAWCDFNSWHFKWFHTFSSGFQLGEYGGKQNTWRRFWLSIKSRVNFDVWGLAWSITTTRWRRRLHSWELPITTSKTRQEQCCSFFATGYSIWCGSDIFSHIIFCGSFGCGGVVFHISSVSKKYILTHDEA